MIASAHRASRSTRSRRLSLMRGASWLPLAAMALVSYAPKAHAQAVNLGGMQARMPTAPQARATVPAGVQRQSPGNSIVTDGQTATNVRVNGSTTTITTQTMSGGNAFNSFKTFSAAEGNTVNLIVPDQAGKLVNIVREGQVNIQGTLNSYQNGRIGGNVVFADSYGLVVGARGSVNVGSLTVVTPNKATIDAMIVNGKVNDGLVARVVTGDVPLSPDGSVVINGRVNATQSIKITATDIKIAGSLQAAQRAEEQRAQFNATVNTKGWKGGGQLVAHGGSISISGANSVAISGTVRAGAGRSGAGTISVASGKSVHVTGSLKADGAAGVNGGKINVTSGGDIAIGGTAKMSVAGVGKNSNAGEIIVKADNNLAVADGAKFSAAAGSTGNGGFVELSAVKTVALGKIDVDLGASAGKAGTLLIDPDELIVGNFASEDAGHKPNITTNGGSVILVADKLITIAADGFIDTTAASGSGDVTLTAPHLVLQGGAKILAGSVGGGAAGTVTLNAIAKNGLDASVLIGDASNKRAVITAGDFKIIADAIAANATPQASVTVQNADVTLSGKFDVAALATVNKSASVLGISDVAATIDVLSGAKIAAASATLAAKATTTLESTMSGSAAAALVDVTSTARARIGGDAEMKVTGALKLTADNIVSSTAKADASSSSAVGASVAVNILKVATSAVITDTAKIEAGSLTLAATSSVVATTSAKASAQGGKEGDSNSDKYLTDAKYKDQAETSGGSVKAVGALAIADVTSTTLAQMASSTQAVVTGATAIKSLTGNASTVIADGSSASGNTGVGVAVGIGLSHISNKSLLDQKIQTGALDVSATMSGTAADNTFSVSATSGAAASNVGVAGALATNLLDSESLARIGGAVAILNNNRVSVTAGDLSTATALAGPSGTGVQGAKVGIGASVALNIVATRSTAELADGSSLAGAGAVALKASGEHAIDTKAEQGSEGGVSVTPALALTMASDRTRASIGQLTNGLVTGGDISVEATQLTTALTQASGTAAGGKAGIGAALAVAVLDEQTLATTSSNINSGGSVSFTAKGAALAATAAVASASGGKEADANGNSTDGDASADAKIGKETQLASGKQASANIGKDGQQEATKKAAEGENGQGKTSEGSVAVAAAIGATVLQSNVKAYVPAAIGVTAIGGLSITSVSNADAKTTADGSAVGSDDATAKVGIGVGLSINLVRTNNDALLGIGSPLSSGLAAAVAGVTAGQYSVASLAMKAAQDNLGVTAPVVTVKSPAAVDAAKQAKPTIAANSGQRLNVFESNASAGAGASNVGFAGAVALNLVDTQSSAQVGGSAAVRITGPAGAISIVSDNESSTIARAMPAGGGASGDKVGVGASVALNLVATRSTAELIDNATVTGADDVTLQAFGVHGVVTQAEQGAKGGVAVTPVIATSLVSDRTKASIGALNGGLEAHGDVSVEATQLTSALTQASGSAAGGKAAVGAALAIAILDEQTIATTSSSIKTAGSVSFAANGASLAATAAIASAQGGNGTDDSGKSTDKDGSVDQKVQTQSGDSAQRMTDAKIGDDNQKSTIAAGKTSADGKATTSEGGVAVAAAIAVDVSMVTVKAFVPSSVGVQAGGALSVTSISNVDAKTSADGSAGAASGSGSTPTKVGVGAAVAVNVVSVDNRAELGTAATATTAGQITGVAAGTYGASALNVAALKTDLGTPSPAVVGGPTMPKAASATTALGRLDQIVAVAKSGASGAKIGIAGSLAVNVLTSTSSASLAPNAHVVITPVGAIDGVTIAADNEAYVAASALAAQDGKDAKVGIGASVGLNTVLNSSEAILAKDATVTGAKAVSVKADTRLDTDTM
ncbi:MAG: leukotoxin LktA family filamentous adhesin, partial [Pseudorhodoplanes sp.]